jgi:uncharacterized protein YneF (UPF0154 family)
MRSVLLLLCGKEAREVMAILWAQKIMMGKKTFADVPRLLKEQVREILIESGCEELLKETEGE